MSGEIMHFCALCQKNKHLVDSHIIPKFVFRWMKRNGTGYLRRPVLPNKREQDGPKKKLLCNDCEQKFSIWENWFKKHVFDPYLSGATTIRYDSSLFLFTVSLLWRISVTKKSEHLKSHIHIAAVDDATEQWRLCLLHGILPSGFSDIHLFFSDIGTRDGVQPVVNWSRYMASATDGTVAESRSRCIIYAKFIRFLFFAGVCPQSINGMQGTKMHPDGGVISVSQKIGDGDIGNFLVDRARKSNEMFVRAISREQLQSIECAMINRGAALAKTDAAAVAMADFAAIVDPSPICTGKIGRNELCPCGSGKKYKRCHASS